MMDVKIIKRLYKDYTNKHLKKIICALLLSIAVAGSTSSIAYLLDPAIKEIFVKKDQTLIVIIPIFIIFEEEELINADTSIILFTSLSLIDLIISFFFKPATSAGLFIDTSSIFAGVKSFPTNMYIQVKIIIANKKFASGPPATIKAR